MLIDNRGNIFGKLNIIDLFLILVIVFVGVFIFRRTLSDTILVPQDTIYLEFFVSRAPDEAVDSIEIGASVYDVSGRNNLGVITNIETGPGFEFVPTYDGQSVRGYQEGFSSVRITSRVNGQYTENGIIVSGNTYNIGHSLTLSAGKGRFWGFVSGAERVDN
jgi:hypothetical protein